MSDDMRGIAGGFFRDSWIIAGLLVLSFLTYHNTFGARFVWDDSSSFLYHKHVQDPSKFFQLFLEDQHAFGRGQGNFYRPLLSVTFLIDYALAGESTVEPGLPAPFVFHFSSVLWHALACVGLFVLLRRLGASAIVGMLAAGIWTVHPLHTEAVAYMSGRADSMSAALMFFGLWFALSSSTGRAKWVATAVSLALYAGALLSKESSFIYPVLLAICLFVSRPTASDVRGVVRYAPLIGSILVLGAYGVLRTTVLSFASGGGGPGTGFFERLIETLQSLARYIELIALPTSLHMERSLDGANIATTIGGVVVLAGAAAIIRYGWRAQRLRIVAGMAWFVASWLPISGIFPLNAPMAEHWMYVPMAGLLWAVLELLAGDSGNTGPHSARTRAVVTGAAVWMLMLLFLSVERNYDWRSNEALFEATLRENPKSTRVQFNLALSYEDAGNMPGARRLYQQMLANLADRRADGTLGDGMRPEEIEAVYSLGTIALDEGNRSLAGRHFGRLVEVAPITDHSRPIAARAAFQLGQLYLGSGNRELGMQYIDQAVQVDPALEAERARLQLR